MEMSVEDMSGAGMSVAGSGGMRGRRTGRYRPRRERTIRWKRGLPLIDLR